HFTFAGNLLIFFSILMFLNAYLFTGMIHTFQNRSLPWIMRHYENGWRWALKGWRPVWLLFSTFLLLVFSFVFLGIRKVPVVFFPKGDPNFIFIYLKLPVGTNVDYTDSVTSVLEKRVNKILGTENGHMNPMVESVISNVAIGAGNPASGDRSTRPELGRIQISFVEYEKRHGRSTTPIMDSIRTALKGIPGAEISGDQEQSGPPTDPPINLEISSDNFEALTATATSLKNYLDSLQTPGVEDLKMD